MISLSNLILRQEIEQVRYLLDRGIDVNQLDEYGFRPLIEAAIVDHFALSELLLKQGADPNQPDVTGGTALQWAAENSNVQLCQLLLEYGADPNSYNTAGQPVLVIPTLRGKKEVKQVLLQAGADPLFAEDYINVKMLGHVFELTGTASILDPKNQYVEVDFEGFFLEVTLGLVAHSLSQFQRHFAARSLRHYAHFARFIADVLQRGATLMKYQQYRIDPAQFREKIDSLIAMQPTLIPVGYEGHAITFIRYQNIWIKIDRREDSRLYDNVMFYHIRRPEQLTNEWIKTIIYKKQTSEFINQEIDQLLDLEPLTELSIESQLSGNCSWANVEAAIPALFFLILMQLQNDTHAMSRNKSVAINYFHRWREWNQQKALDLCIRGFQRGDAIRKACKAEILAAVLFQRCDDRRAPDVEKIEQIFPLLLNSPYEYILKNYLKSYYYEDPTEEGKRFSELFKKYSARNE